MYHEVRREEAQDRAFLEKIRRTEKEVSPGRAALHTGLVFLFGAGLGLFAKYLDYRQGQLPGLLQALDEALGLHNFLGRFSPWVLIAVCLALYSRSALRAAVAALQKPAIGRVTGAEYQFIEIEGERYIAE